MQFVLYRLVLTGNGNLLPVQNYFRLPLTGNGRNSIMVALADLRITVIFLQMEKIPALQVLSLRVCCQLAALIAAQVDICESSHL